MARAPDPQFRAWVQAAKAYPLAELVVERGGRLRGAVEKSGPCPACGGRDRFNVNTRKAVWFCRGCAPSGGDVVDLVMHLDQCDFVRACETLTGTASPNGGGHGLSVEELARLEIERANKRAAADDASARFREQEREKCWRWWQAAIPPQGTPVEAYLALRRLTIPRGAHLKYRPDAELWADGKRGSAIVHTGPAMVAAILNPAGIFTGLHTTWIDLREPDGKARVPDDQGEFIAAKKVRGSQQRGRIELVRHASPRRMVIGEGIETTLSMRDDLIEAGREIDDTAFWAGINLGNIGGPHEALVPHPTQRDRAGRARKVPGPVPAGEGIPIPESVDEIVILGDGDSDPFLTATTLTRASHRWARPGRVIRGARAPAGADFNNLRRGAP